MPYSRWLPVHIRYITTFAAKQTDVPPALISANCVVHTTNNKFSVMILDQYHEQNNANVKGSGNQLALRCWMVAGQEIGTIRLELEEQASYQQDGAYVIGHPASQLPAIWIARNIRVGG